VAYLLKNFLDPHLIKLIGNQFQVRSIEEYGQFLSLPTNVATLEEQSRKLQRALEFRSDKESNG
jgi:hypothetical protein